MLRFHLHIVNGCETIPDHEGEEFTSLQHAEAEAAQSARDLMAEALRSGVSIGAHREILITSSDGVVRASIEFDAVLDGRVARRARHAGMEPEMDERYTIRFFTKNSSDELDEIASISGVGGFNSAVTAARAKLQALQQGGRAVGFRIENSSGQVRMVQQVAPPR